MCLKKSEVTISSILFPQTFPVIHNPIMSWLCFSPRRCVTVVFLNSLVYYFMCLLHFMLDTQLGVNLLFCETHDTVSDLSILKEISWILDEKHADCGCNPLSNFHWNELEWNVNYFFFHFLGSVNKKII